MKSEMSALQNLRVYYALAVCRVVKPFLSVGLQVHSYLSGGFSVVAKCQLPAKFTV